MAALIDVGTYADNYANTASATYTYIDVANPANALGILLSVSFWFATNATGVKVGTFFGSGTNYTSRGVATIGSVTAGSRQSFPVRLAVLSGDFIGIYWATGGLSYNTVGGTAVYYGDLGADWLDGASHAYTKLNTYRFSMYGVGVAGGNFLHARRDRMDMQAVSTHNR